MKIVVVGGSGRIGGSVVENLRTRGHQAVVAAPTTGVDVVTGSGLREVLDGAQVVVDVANAPSWEDDAVLEFFRTASQNLVAAEAQAGVGHHVALSIVGADRLPDSGYLRAKIAQEHAIELGTVPYTIVRSTQFFEFLRGIADAATEGGVVRVAPALFQPIAADDVATFVSDVALEPPTNGRVEIAGPEPIGLDVLIQDVLAADGDARRVIADPHARYFGAELTDSSLVPLGSARLGPTRFTDWLAAHPIQPSI